MLPRHPGASMGRGPIRTLVVAVVLGAAAPGAASADVTLTSLTDPATAEASARAIVLEPWKQVGRSAPFGGRLELDPRVLDIAARVDLSLFARAALTIVTAVEQTAPALGVLPSEKLAPAGCPGVGGDAIYES